MSIEISCDICGFEPTSPCVYCAECDDKLTELKEYKVYIVTTDLIHSREMFVGVYSSEKNARKVFPNYDFYVEEYVIDSAAKEWDFQEKKENK